MFDKFFAFLNIKTGSAIAQADGTVLLTQEQFAQLNERIAAVTNAEKAHQEQLSTIQKELATEKSNAQATITQLQEQLSKAQADLQTAQTQLTATVGQPIATDKDKMAENPSEQDLLKAEVANFEYNKLARMSFLHE